MQWFKSHVNLRNNPIYRRMTPLARNAFDNAMRTAADYEQNGALSTRIGPLNDDELSHDLIVPRAKLDSVLAELIDSGFVSRDENGVLWVQKFAAKTESSAARQRRYRARKQLQRDDSVTSTGDGNSDVTGDGVTGDARVTVSQVTGEIEEEIEIDQVTNVTGVPPRQSALKLKKPLDMAAYRILDAAVPVVFGQHELAISQKAWRSHNKRAATELAETGKTPDQVVAMLETAYGHPEGRRFYGGITTLAKLAEHWPKLAALDEPDDSEMRRAIANGDYLPRV